MILNKQNIGEGRGNRLLAIRKSLNLSPKQMAARLEVNRNTYYKNENGETRPGWKSLQILINTYKISIDWLLYNKGPIFINEKVPNLSEIQAQRKNEKELLEQTVQNLKESEENTKHFNTLKKLQPDIEPLMEAMINDPELRHDILLKFYRHQKQGAEKD